MATHEIELFSFTNKDDLLKLREQYISDIHYHGQALIEVQKYFTTLLSALLSAEITLFSATYIAFSTFLLVNRILLLLYLPIPIIILFLVGVASDNCKREYRNVMEYMGTKIKIDELLGIYEEKGYNEFKEKKYCKFLIRIKFLLIHVGAQIGRKDGVIYQVRNLLIRW